MDLPIRNKNHQINGIGVSPGISIGRAFVISKNTAVLTGVVLKEETAKQYEVEKYTRAVKTSIEEVESIKMQAEPGLQEGIDILETHIELLGDPQIGTDVSGKIMDEGKTANDAVIEVITEIVKVFTNMEDEYMSARAADVQDIGNRILKHLNKSSGTI